MPTLVRQNDGAPGDSFKLTTTDTATAFATAKIYNSSSGTRAKGALVTVEDDEVRVAWGEDPTQAGLGHLLSSGDSLEMNGYSQLSRFKYISADAGNAAVLQVTVYW